GPRCSPRRVATLVGVSATDDAARSETRIRARHAMLERIVPRLKPDMHPVDIGFVTDAQLWTAHWEVTGFESKIAEGALPIELQENSRPPYLSIGASLWVLR